MPSWDISLQFSLCVGVQVTKNKTWKDIAGLLGIGASSSAAYTLRKHYTKNLLAFECHFDRGGIDPQPIINQVEASSKKKNSKAASVPSPGQILSCCAVKLRYSCSCPKPQRGELVTFWRGFVICRIFCHNITLSIVQGVESDSSVRAPVCTGSLLVFWHTRGVGVVG